jgi:hypothetical protein
MAGEHAICEERPLWHYGQDNSIYVVRPQRGGWRHQGPRLRVACMLVVILIIHHGRLGGSTSIHQEQEQ